MRGAVRLAASAVRARRCVLAPAVGADRDRHHPRQHRAAADRHPEFRRRRRRRPARRRRRRGHHVRPPALRPVPAARSGDLHAASTSGRTTRRASPTGRCSTRRRWSPAASTRQADGRLRAEFRLWDVFAGQQMSGQQFFTSPGQLAARRPHHRRRDLRAAHRREGLLRHPRRLRRRKRPEGQPRQAPRDHGSGRRQRALPDARAPTSC